MRLKSVSGVTSVPVRIVNQPPSYEKAAPYRRVRAADLPSLMKPGESRPHVPLSLLIKQWDSFPQDREIMIKDAPVGPDPEDLCRIAAVVHALCDRDGVQITDWVWGHKSAVALAWDRSCTMRGFIWEHTLVNAPPACEYHNVWFDYQFIASVRSRVTKENYTEFIIR